MSIINNGLLLASEAAGAGGYQVSRSLRFNSSDSAYLSRTPASAGNRKTWTWSGWVKRARLGTEEALFACGTSGSDTAFGQIIFSTGDTLRVNAYGTTWRDTSQVFRDCSAWYHIVVAFDTTQSTANDRVKVYVNGQQVTSWGIINNPTQNTDYAINQNIQHTIGRFDLDGGGNYLSAYLADIYFLDGTATTPSTFAETDAVTGQWVPKTPTGISYGTNGFRLSLSDNSGTTSTTLGKDSAGSNNWTPNNFSVASGSGNDSLVDTPTSYGTDTGAGGEVRGNYATLNPLKYGGDIQAPTNGNLDVTSIGSATGKILGTIGVSSGKWYWECVPNSSQNIAFGVTKDNTVLANYPGQDAVDYTYHNDGSKYSNNSGSAYGASYTTNDVIGVALDADNGTLTFYKNNSSQGQAYSGLTSGPYFPLVGDPSSTPDISCTVNFGQRAFAYTAPSGFKALVDTNLPAPLVAKPNTVMDVSLWTGNGTQTVVTGLQYSPDFVWIKSRSTSAYHMLFDTVRGAQARLHSNTTDQEQTGNNDLTAFNSDGYTLDNNSAPANTDVNGSGITYVGWSWDAGTSTVTNTQGSITSQVRANASAGFSVVSWSANNTANQSIGHGLGVTPAFIIHKNRTTAGNWNCWFTGFSNDEYINLNGTGAKASTGGGLWYQTPTSSLFYIGFTGSAINNSTDAIISYCFAPVAGYSSAFSYTGNGSSDGPAVWLGFKPALILVKRTDSTGDWRIWDMRRDGYNVTFGTIAPNSSSAENTSEGAGVTGIDFLSSGFKLRSTGSFHNASGGTYVGFAFAESPFQYARAR